MSVYVCVLLPPCGYVLYNATRENTTGVDQRRYGATARTFNIPTRRLYISGIFLVGQIDAKNIHFGVKCLDSTLRLILVTSRLIQQSLCSVGLSDSLCGFGHQIKKKAVQDGMMLATNYSLSMEGKQTFLNPGCMNSLALCLFLFFLSSMSF